MKNHSRAPAPDVRCQFVNNVVSKHRILYTELRMSNASSILSNLHQPPDLVDQVRQALVDAICNGDLNEDQRYTQETLAQSLGVSRQPVLQALLLLRQQGLVQDTANKRGVIVSPLGATFIGELYAVRARLEGLAAELAAQQVTPAATTKGQDILKRGKQAAAAGSSDLVQLDLLFHSWITETAGNNVLADMQRQYALQVRRVMARYLRPASAGKQSWQEHQHLANAIFSGNSALAGKLAQDHVEQAARFVIDHITNTVPLGSPPRARAHQNKETY
jgi:DNA-binding GntR family transcriptional regulator